ncbi:MAG: RNA polymerase sigma factor, partial [Microcella sp.]
MTTRSTAATPAADSLEAASDAVLAQRAADGDTAAFAALVTRHGPYLRAYAIRLTGSPSDADDALQETLIAAWERLDRLENPAAVRAWLSSILTRKA